MMYKRYKRQIDTIWARSTRWYTIFGYGVNLKKYGERLDTIRAKVYSDKKLTDTEFDELIKSIDETSYSISALSHGPKIVQIKDPNGVLHDIEVGMK